MKEKNGLKIAESILYFFAALATFYFANLALGVVLYRFQDFFYSAPLLFFLANGIYFFFVLHLFTHPVNEVKRIQTATVNGTLLVLFAFLDILLITIFRLNGTYSSLLIGGLAPLFPLEAYLGSFLILILGTALYFYGAHLKKHPHPYVYNPHEWKNKKQKVLTSIARPLFALIALYYLGAVLVSPWLMSFSSEHAFGLISFILLMLLPSAMVGVYNWNYLDKEPLPQRQRLYKNSLILTSFALLLALLYWFSQALDPLFLIDGMAYALPVDLFTRIKWSPYLLILTSLSASLISFLHYLNRNVPKKGENT